MFCERHLCYFSLLLLQPCESRVVGSIRMTYPLRESLWHHLIGTLISSVLLGPHVCILLKLPGRITIIDLSNVQRLPSYLVLGNAASSRTPVSYTSLGIVWLFSVCLGYWRF
ncbi:hypothetical protein BS47DRAFT_171195 [Hydnum rufescens UP504]|uniref:Secreted protein n=1 Tax=Hydnum rufescens UP504 TaxID=1448309 RepID=A0A9P6B7F9_9AGAM|nr:hypothetical protein BS47DRAFT_171195 [Hydnum rufescens UP504]